MQPPACLCFPRSDGTVFFFFPFFWLILLKFFQLDMNLFFTVHWKTFGPFAP